MLNNLTYTNCYGDIPVGNPCSVKMSTQWNFDFEHQENIRIVRDFVYSNSTAIQIACVATLLSSIALFVFYYVVMRKDARVQKLVNCFPGPPTFPIFGNSLSLIRPNDELILLKDTWGKEYGFLFRIWIANLPFIIVSSAPAVEKILGSNIHIEKSVEYEAIGAWLGTGLLTASGQKWQGRRKLLTPTFHFKILEDFFDVFNEKSRILVHILEEKYCNGKSFNMYPYFTRCALDIICETAMGKEINAQTGKDLSYIKAVYGLSEILVHRITKPWLRYQWIFELSSEGRLQRKYLKVLHTFTEQVIAERKAERRKNAEESRKHKAEESDDGATFTRKRKAFLDLMLDISEDGKTLSDADIREEVDTIMFEGHDTTAANLNWTLFLLASYPEHQRKVQDELDEIFGSDVSRDVTMADVSKMKYLECCIKESLRLYPSVPIIGRKLNSDCPLDDGLIMPAGCVAAVVPFLLHRDPSVFPDPESFQPERFTSQNSMGRHPYAYVPFSAGPRNCIGQKFAMFEEKVVLANVLRNFTLEAAEKMEDVKIVPDMILRPLNGLHVKLSKREL